MSTLSKWAVNKKFKNWQMKVFIDSLKKTAFLFQTQLRIWLCYKKYIYMICLSYRYFWIVSNLGNFLGLSILRVGHPAARRAPHWSALSNSAFFIFLTLEPRSAELEQLLWFGFDKNKVSCTLPQLRFRRPAARFIQKEEFKHTDRKIFLP